MRTFYRSLLLLGVLIATGIFEFWFMGLHLEPMTHRNNMGGLIDSYTEALSQGKSHLVTPLALTAGLPAAQQPPGDPRLRILDASYHNGKYYIYYGIGPFIWLHVPWRLLTGTYLAPGLGILAGMMIGYTAYGAALLVLFRNDRRRITDVLLPSGFVAMIVSGATWVLMDQHEIHELETAWNFGVTGLAVLNLVLAGVLRKRRTLALGAALFFASLIMACRPNCAPAVAMIAAVAGVLAWRENGNTRQRLLRMSGIAIPLVAVGAGLAIWNMVRFGNPVEFGMNHGTGAVAIPRMVEFTPANIPYNLHRYLLGGFRTGNYFPFIDGVKEGPFPLPVETHEAVDQIYGCLLLFPVLLFGLITLRHPSRAGWPLFAASGCILLLLSLLGFGTYRYTVDYLGPLAFAAGAGICLIAGINNRLLRLTLLACVAPLLAWSALAGLFQATSIYRVHGLFDTKRPTDFAHLARPFDRIMYRLEPRLCTRPSTLKIQVWLPADKYGQVEPLLVTGDPGLQDFLYFYYTAPGMLQMGFESIGQGGPLMPPVAVDYAAPHLIEVFIGSMLPPDSHPLLHGLSSGELGQARSRLCVSIDGNVVMEEPIRHHPIRSRLLFGTSPDNPAFGSRFTGELSILTGSAITTADIVGSTDRGLYGPLRMEIIPHPMPPGSKQPLLSVGHRPGGAMLVLLIVDAHTARLRWEQPGNRVTESEPIGWEPERLQVLEIAAGSLFPGSHSTLWGREMSQEEIMRMKGKVRVTLNGSEIWSFSMQTPESYPSSVRIGQNGLLQSEVATALSAEIKASRRIAW